MADLTLNRKTDEVITFQYYDSDGTTPRALTGATILFTVKPNSYDSDDDDSEAILSKTITSHTNAAAGQSSITLTDVDTNVTPSNYFYDIKVVESDGKIYKATSGRCLISGSPTNRTS
jgi:hypothetical protein